MIEYDRFQRTVNHKVAFFGYYDGRWRRVVVKQAMSANELYIASYHKVRSNQVPESIRKEHE